MSFPHSAVGFTDCHQMGALSVGWCRLVALIVKYLALIVKSYTFSSLYTAHTIHDIGIVKKVLVVGVFLINVHPKGIIGPTLLKVLGNQLGHKGV